MKIKCTTQFDITVTGVTGHFRPSRIPFNDSADQTIGNIEQWNQSRNQQRNWETIIQLLSLRTQIVNVTVPVVDNNRWSFEFDVDTEHLFSDGLDELAILKQDCANVPMIVGLKEINLVDSVLVPDSNIQFELMPVNIQ